MTPTKLLQERSFLCDHCGASFQGVLRDFGGWGPGGVWMLGVPLCEDCRTLPLLTLIDAEEAVAK